MDLSFANLAGNILFSSIGFVAFVYGKKMGYVRCMVIGVVLMVYPYALPDTRAMYAVGALLTASLFIFRD